MSQGANAYIVREGGGKMERWKYLVQQMPEPAKSMLAKISDREQEKIREIRFRVNRPTMLCGEKRWGLGEKGLVDLHASWRPSMQACRSLLDGLCGHAVYAYEEEIKEGYLTLRGGFRVGMTGEMIRRDEKIVGISDASMFCIRIPHEHIGACRRILHCVLSSNARIQNTLVFSPPGKGKTSLLRDLAREISRDYAVAVVDERSEIAACHKGIPQLEVGDADVLSNCSKRIAIPQLVRAMSPQIIITDEIGTENEVRVLMDAAASGVAIIASAHADSLQGARRRSMLREAVDSGLFSRYIVLGETPGEIAAVLDGGENTIWP